MEFLERDLEDIIFKSKKSNLSERGLIIQGAMKRQVRIGNYGVADLVTLHKTYCPDFISKRLVIDKVVITVYELKRGDIGLNTLLQALRYGKGIKRYIESTKFASVNINNALEIRFVLLGKKINISSDIIYLNDFIKELEDEEEIYPLFSYIEYNYDIDGITFSEIDTTQFKLVDEGF